MKNQCSLDDAAGRHCSHAYRCVSSHFTVYRYDDSSIEADDTIDLTVSYDGWHVASSRSTGSAVSLRWWPDDQLEAMSLYCQRCAYASTRHSGVNTRGFIEWFKTHEPGSNKNYEWHRDERWGCRTTVWLIHQLGHSITASRQMTSRSTNNYTVMWYTMHIFYISFYVPALSTHI